MNERQLDLLMSLLPQILLKRAHLAKVLPCASVRAATIPPTFSRARLSPKVLTETHVCFHS
jgi:hypothetical protein